MCNVCEIIISYDFEEISNLFKQNSKNLFVSSTCELYIKYKMNNETFLIEYAEQNVKFRFKPDLVPCISTNSLT